MATPSDSTEPTANPSSEDENVDDTAMDLDHHLARAEASDPAADNSGDLSNNNDTQSDVKETLVETTPTVTARKKRGRPKGAPVKKAPSEGPAPKIKITEKEYLSEGIEFLIRTHDNIDDPEATQELPWPATLMRWHKAYDLRYTKMTAKKRYRVYRDRFLADYGEEYPRDIALYYRSIRKDEGTRYIPTKPFPSPSNSVQPLYAQLRVRRFNDTFDGFTYLPYEAVRQHTRKFEASEQLDTLAAFRFDVRGPDKVAFERCIQCIFPQQLRRLPPGFLELDHSMLDAPRDDMILRIHTYDLEDLVWMYVAAEEMNLTDICDMVLDHLCDSFTSPERKDVQPEKVIAWRKEILDSLRDDKPCLDIPAGTDLVADYEILSWFWAEAGTNSLLRRLLLDVLADHQ